MKHKINKATVVLQITRNEFDTLQTLCLEFADLFDAKIWKKEILIADKISRVNADKTYRQYGKYGKPKFTKSI